MSSKISSNMSGNRRKNLVSREFRQPRVRTKKKGEF